MWPLTEWNKWSPTLSLWPLVEWNKWSPTLPDPSLNETNEAILSLSLSLSFDPSWNETNEALLSLTLPDWKKWSLSLPLLLPPHLPYPFLSSPSAHSLILIQPNSVSAITTLKQQETAGPLTFKLWLASISLTGEIGLVVLRRQVHVVVGQWLLAGSPAKSLVLRASEQVERVPPQLAVWNKQV